MNGQTADWKENEFKTCAVSYKHNNGSHFTPSQMTGESYIKAPFGIALVHIWSTFVPRLAILLARASDRKLRLVPGQRARAISAMFVTVGNVYCFNCSRLSWRAGSSRFDPWRWAKRIAARRTRMCVVSPHSSQDQLLRKSDRPRLRTLRSNSTMGFSSRQSEQRRTVSSKLTSPPNDVIIWTESSSQT